MRGVKASFVKPGQWVEIPVGRGCEVEVYLVTAVDPYYGGTVSQLGHPTRSGIRIHHEDGFIPLHWNREVYIHEKRPTEATVNPCQSEKIRKASIRARDRNRFLSGPTCCERCENNAEAVHHVYYVDGPVPFPDAVELLCGPCHRHYETHLGERYHREIIQPEVFEALRK